MTAPKARFLASSGGRPFDDRFRGDRHTGDHFISNHHFSDNPDDGRFDPTGNSDYRFRRRPPVKYSFVSVNTKTDVSVKLHLGRDRLKKLQG